MSQDESSKWFHDIRSSLNGVICMGSLLEDTELSSEQRELLSFMISSANKSVEMLEVHRAEIRSRENPDTPIKNSCSSAIESSFKILVAEDDDINRLYLSTILQRQNWEVHEAVDGLQAVEMCRQNSYKIILMDVSMPGLDGFQATKQIRGFGDNTPIIAITAHSLLDLQSSLSDTGVNEVLRKPFNEKDLLESIHKLIGDLSHLS